MKKSLTILIISLALAGLFWKIPIFPLRPILIASLQNPVSAITHETQTPDFALGKEYVEVEKRYDLNALKPYYFPKDPRQFKRIAISSIMHSWESVIHINPEEVDFKLKASLGREKKYKPYYGLVHGHTNESDGIGSPDEAYHVAKNLAGLDFFAVTDHPEYWLFKNKNAWSDLSKVVNKYNSENFLALKGFEYTHPALGHYIVLNTSDYCTSFSEPKDFYGWLKKRPDAVSIFAHPGYHPYRNKLDLKHFELDKGVSPQLIGIEVFHKNLFKPFLLGYEKKLPYLDEAWQNGWSIGSVASQDNHYNNWGLQDDARLVVFMKSLSNENFFDALRNRRFYATSNSNQTFYLEAKTKSGWAPMGSQLSRHEVEDNLLVEATYADANADTPPERIEVVVNGKVESFLNMEKTLPKISPYITTLGKKLRVREVTPNQSYVPQPTAGKFTFDIPLPKGEKGVLYFYVRIYQENGKTFTQSSPISINL